MNTHQNSLKQEYLDIGAAPFFIIGVLWTLPSIIPLISVAFQDEAPLLIYTTILYVLLIGIGTIFIGIGIMNRWRFIWIPAIILSILGLPSFPIGTILYGWAIFALWKARHSFYPFYIENKT